MARWEYMAMIPQTMMTTSATVLALRVPMNNENIELSSFHVVHLKQLRKFLLLTYRLVHVRVQCRVVSQIHKV